MSTHQHEYAVTITWTGNRGEGTRAYDGYGREHVVTADGPGSLDGSSDPAFRGNPERWNPEQLFVAALSQCHMLAYLHLAQRAGVVVTEYADDASGVLVMDARGGGGEFSEVVLRPRVVISAGDPTEAERLHDDVDAVCFIARSVKIPVRHEPHVTTTG